MLPSQFSGNLPSSKDLLKVITNPLTISCFTCLSNDTLISSVALVLSQFISFRISSESVGRKYKELAIIGSVR